jgi:hypothetical protein
MCGHEVEGRRVIVRLSPFEHGDPQEARGRRDGTVRRFGTSFYRGLVETRFSNEESGPADLSARRLDGGSTSSPAQP